MKNPELAVLWQRIVTMLRRFEADMEVTRNEPGYYRMVTPFKPKRPFAAVMVQKRHVGLYLMPVYDDPDIMSYAPAILSERKTGVVCLRFTTEQDPALDALPELFEACAASYAAKGHL